MAWKNPIWIVCNNSCNISSINRFFKTLIALITQSAVELTLYSSTNSLFTDGNSKLVFSLWNHKLSLLTVPQKCMTGVLRWSSPEQEEQNESQTNVHVMQPQSRADRFNTFPDKSNNIWADQAAAAVYVNPIKQSETPVLDETWDCCWE